MRKLIIICCCLTILVSACSKPKYTYRNMTGTVVKTNLKPDWWGTFNMSVDGMVDERTTLYYLEQNPHTDPRIPESERQKYAAQPTATSTPDAVKERTWKIKRQFDSWDGSHTKLKQYVKNQMNDPKSFEHVKTEYADKGDYIYLEMSFRGKNALGALVLNKVVAKATIDGQILEVHLME